MTSRMRMWSVGVAVATCVAACGDPEIIVPDILLVITVLPAHGSADISVDVEALVYFSHAVADTTGAAASLSVECLGDPPCATPTSPGNCPATTAATVVFEPNGQTAHIVPDAALAGNTCYAVVIAQGIEASDAEVGPLPVDIRSSFYTRP